MRGIYNLTTLERSAYSPIINKVFETFMAFCVIGTIIGALALILMTQSSGTYSISRDIAENIALVWIGFLLAQWFVLRALLHNSISPLVRLLTSARGSTSLNHIEVPSNISVELQEIYNIVNDSLAQTRMAQEKILDAERNAAIASTTQMLAHDVRRPFSMLRMAMLMLGNAEDPESVKSVMSRVVPQIDRVMSSVDGMLADVMEVGSVTTNLIQEPVSPESLIESTLGDIIRLNPDANFAFTYDLKHTHMVNAHIQKMGRVFANIIGNAFQATRNKGNMWFKTTETNAMITFCVGNSGSFVPAESLPKLFDAFFTSGKKTGTGLGLAIAKKIVTAHGGNIWCDSSKTEEHPDGKVEFYFTLPIADQKNTTTANLPRTSADIVKHLDMRTEPKQSNISADKDEVSLEEDIIASHVSLDRKFRVLIIDDEHLYRSALVTRLTRTPELTKAIDISQAEGSVDALEIMSHNDYDLVITDVDLGMKSLDGFELVRKFRGAGSKSLICVHSNRSYGSDNKTAIEAGADSFMPKPMAHAQLLRLLLQATSTMTSATRDQIVNANIEASKAMPGVLVIDNTTYNIYEWTEMLAKDTNLHTMRSFEELTAKISAEPEFLRGLSYVVTDVCLRDPQGDGLAVGKLIKSICPTIPVFMTSNDIIQKIDLEGAIDRVIPKRAIGLAGLRAWQRLSESNG